MDLQTIIQELKSKGIVFEVGLSLDEIKCIEQVYDIVFPPDLM